MGGGAPTVGGTPRWACSGCGCGCGSYGVGFRTSGYGAVHAAFCELWELEDEKRSWGVEGGLGRDAEDVQRSRECVGEEDEMGSEEEEARVGLIRGLPRL